MVKSPKQLEKELKQLDELKNVVESLKVRFISLDGTAVKQAVLTRKEYEVIKPILESAIRPKVYKSFRATTSKGF